MRGVFVIEKCTAEVEHEKTRINGEQVVVDARRRQAARKVVGRPVGRRSQLSNGGVVFIGSSRFYSPAGRKHRFALPRKVDSYRVSPDGNEESFTCLSRVRSRPPRCSGFHRFLESPSPPVRGRASQPDVSHDGRMPFYRVTMSPDPIPLVLSGSRCRSVFVIKAVDGEPFRKAPACRSVACRCRATTARRMSSFTKPRGEMVGKII